MRDKRVPGLVEEFERLEATKRKPATVEAFEAQDTGLKGLPDIAVPDTSVAMPGFQHPAPTEQTAHPLKPLFDAMGWIKRKADIEIPGTGTEVLGHEFPGETRRRLFEPIPNPESDPIISITNALKGFLGLTPDIPEFLLKDLPEAAKGTFTPEGQLKPETPTLGRVGKQMGQSTIDVMALAVMRQFHPEEYKRFVKTERGAAIREMEAERLHEPALLPLIASGAMGKVAKLTGKLGKAKMPLIPEKAPAPVRDIMPKLRYEPKAEAPPMMELPGIKKPKIKGVGQVERPTPISVGKKSARPTPQIEEALGRSIKEMKLEDPLPIVENDLIRGQYVTVEPWHDICLKNIKCETAEAAHNKFIRNYKKANPDKEIVYAELEKTDFSIIMEEGEIGHHGFSYVVSKPKPKAGLSKEIDYKAIYKEVNVERLKKSKMQLEVHDKLYGISNFLKLKGMTLEQANTLRGSAKQKFLAEHRQWLSKHPDLAKPKVTERYAMTTEQNKLQSSINEAKTILKGKISGERRASVERSLKDSQAKLDESLRMEKHRATLLKKARDYDILKGAKVTDVTPEGYGPTPTKPKAPPTRAKAEVFNVGDKVTTKEGSGFTIVTLKKDGIRAIVKADVDGRTGLIKLSELSKKPKPSERGAMLNIPKEIARPAGAEPVPYKEAIKTPDRPEMANMESYYKTIMAPEAFRPPAVEFAKQPGIARQIGIAERQTKGGKVVPAVRKAGTFVPEDFATYKNFKDAKQGVGGGTKDWIRYVQEIDGSLSLQKKAKLPGQAGPAEKYILRRTEDIVKIELDWSAEQSLRIKEITKGITEKQERLVTEVLEETSRPGSYVKTADFATNARIRKITSDTKVVKAAQESRKALEHWFSQQNKLRGLRNQELIDYRQYYAPHILRETSLWERAFGGQVKAKEVVRGPQLPDYIKPNKPFNPRELAREIGLKNYMREMRIGKILEDYANTASRDIHHTSIIQNNKAFVQHLETMGYKNAAEGVGNFTAESFGRVKARMDRAVDFPVKVQKGMRFWRGSLMRSVFPLNWTWNTTVQTLSSGLTVMRTGVTNSTRGLVDWFANPTMRNKIKSSYSYRIKSRRGGRITRQDINTGVTEMVQGRRSAWQAAIDGANYTTELVERHLTGWSIASGLRHGAKRGLKGRALWDYASDTGAKTQSMYNLENKPGVLRSETVQTAAPFQTFIFEMYNTAKEFAGRTGTPPGAMTERIGWVLRFTAAAYAGNEMANAITGRRPWEIYSFIPFSDQTIKPVVDALRGKPYDAISGRGLPSFVGAGIQFARAVRGYLRTGDTRKLRNWGLKYGTAFMKIPGGTQIARMVDGWIAVANEGMKDAGGKTLFKIKDPWEKARAIAMGPWRTKAGIEYWEKRETNILEDILGKPKKKKRLSIVPDLNAMRR